MSARLMRLVQGMCAWPPANACVCWHGPRARRKVAITFDDGPRRAFTPRILETLARHRARATFFVEGKWVRENPELLARAVAAGHEIGNHAFEHGAAGGLPAQAALCAEALASHGVTTRLFRPPFGRVRGFDVLRLALHGYRTVLWSVDSRDSMRHEGKWQGPAPDYLRVLRPGDIVLLHDDNPVCVDELRRLLDAVEALSLDPVTVSHLMGFDAGRGAARYVPKAERP